MALFVELFALHIYNSLKIIVGFGKILEKRKIVTFAFQSSVAFLIFVLGDFGFIGHQVEWTSHHAIGGEGGSDSE